jgi:hypothetical protein
MVKQKANKRQQAGQLANRFSSGETCSSHTFRAGLLAASREIYIYTTNRE